ncbi:replication-associated recombination protein A [Pectinatus frisingensis]|uniref:replication-associated recombination protein A n=1 Tax=Pectinatus frisingensis TaxID=865 RepID=UPI0039BF46A7
MDLFTSAALNAEKNAGIDNQKPLAVRMRPQAFDEFVGQEDSVGKGRFLRVTIENDRIPSLILFGPPGTGKTTLARMIAVMTKSNFKQLNAVAAGIADIRKVVDEAHEQRKFYQKRTIVFIDEIHRFNKSQQDVLLPYVEDGRIILIGATTENPYFEVNHALLSRVRVVRLHSLSDKQMIIVLQKALCDKKRGLGEYGIGCAEPELITIAQAAAGDARVALNLLEQAAMLAHAAHSNITAEILSDILGEKLQTYDKKGDNHYDTVSAFIKSMRGSDPDAAIHYLARMIVAGEDVNFIARRIAICAAEDVGNADPMALVVAMAAVQAVQFIGLPEARIPLAQAVTYIASAPKSNAAYLSIDSALQDVRTKDCGTIPLHLKDAHYKGAEKLGHGIDYKYPHDFNDHFIKQQYLPTKIMGKKYYDPTSNGHEKIIKQYLATHQNFLPK